MTGKIITLITIYLISLSFAYEGFRSNLSSPIWFTYCFVCGFCYLYVCMKLLIQLEREDG